MSLPLAHYLKDFSSLAPGAPAPAGFGDIDNDPFDIQLEDIPQLPAIDIEAERRQAYAEGVEAAEREANNRHEERLAELRAIHAQELAELREQYARETAMAIASGLRVMAEELSAAVADQTAQVLAPLVSELVSAKAVKDLAQLIDNAVLSGAAGTIVVRGPAALFDSLREQLPESVTDIRHVEAEDLDLSVEIGETVLVTRVSAWTASLRKVLG